MIRWAKSPPYKTVQPDRAAYCHAASAKADWKTGENGSILLTIGSPCKGEKLWQDEK